MEALANVVYRPGDIGAAIASGSFETAGMIVAPCSIKSLSGIAHSFGEDLITRAADVQMKEGRAVLLMVRETPLHLGHLELMTQAARIGYIIFPPSPRSTAAPRPSTTWSTARSAASCAHRDRQRPVLPLAGECARRQSEKLRQRIPAAL